MYFKWSPSIDKIIDKLNLFFVLSSNSIWFVHGVIFLSNTILGYFNTKLILTEGKQTIFMCVTQNRYKPMI